MKMDADSLADVDAPRFQPYVREAPAWNNTEVDEQGLGEPQFLLAAWEKVSGVAYRTARWARAKGREPGSGWAEAAAAVVGIAAIAGIWVVCAATTGAIAAVAFLGFSLLYMVSAALLTVLGVSVGFVGVAVIILYSYLSAPFARPGPPPPENESNDPQHDTIFERARRALSQFFWYGRYGCVRHWVLLFRGLCECGNDGLGNGA